MAFNIVVVGNIVLCLRRGGLSLLPFGPALAQIDSKSTYFMGTPTIGSNPFIGSGH